MGEYVVIADQDDSNILVSKNCALDSAWTNLSLFTDVEGIQEITKSYLVELLVKPSSHLWVDKEDIACYAGKLGVIIDRWEDTLYDVFIPEAFKSIGINSLELVPISLFEVITKVITKSKEHLFKMLNGEYVSLVYNDINNNYIKQLFGFNIQFHLKANTKIKEIEFGKNIKIDQLSSISVWGTKLFLADVKDNKPVYSKKNI